jgi:hypothetical protein
MNTRDGVASAHFGAGTGVSIAASGRLQPTNNSAPAMDAPKAHPLMPKLTRLLSAPIAYPFLREFRWRNRCETATSERRTAAFSDEKHISCDKD